MGGRGDGDGDGGEDSKETIWQIRNSTTMSLPEVRARYKPLSSTQMWIASLSACFMMLVSESTS